MRPRFEVVTSCPSQRAAERLRAALNRADAPCRGRVHGSHVVLHVLDTQERVWSPFLSLDMEWHRDGTLLRGLFGPKPSVWTLFMASYAICAFLAVFALGFAYAQWSIGQPAWALLLVPAAALGALATWAFASYGRRRGRDQMDLLRGFLDDTLGAT